MALKACMFTNTPDEHFVLDHHPEFPQVVLASPCSGHGYKFCSVVGEILADLATGDGRTQHDIGFLRLRRPDLMEYMTKSDPRHSASAAETSS